MQKIRIIFRKGESARFLSHLDMMATFEYAVRRAQLPVEVSQGFSPRLRISAAAPLALGYIGEREILDVVLREPMPPDEICLRLQAAVPPGITIQTVDAMPDYTRPSASRLQSAVYRIDLPEIVPDVEERIVGLMKQEHLIVEEPRERGVRKRDLRWFLISIELVKPCSLRIVTSMDGEGSVRPEQILDLLSLPQERVRITRERLDVADQ